jgi:hypothetical protein
MTHDEESDKAAAHLYRLAQATALLRLYREAHGHHAQSTEALAAWIERRRRRSGTPVEPSREDFERVEREHPDLVALARRSDT